MDLNYQSTRGALSLIHILFPNFPYPGDYELTNLGIRGNLLFSNDIICFDKKTSSYMLVRTGEMKRFDYTNDSEKAFIPYDMGKTVPVSYTHLSQRFTMSQTIRMEKEF